MTKEHHLGNLFIKYYSSYNSPEKKIFDLVVELAIAQELIEKKYQLISNILDILSSDEKKVSIHSSNEEIIEFIKNTFNKNTSEHDKCYFRESIQEKDSYKEQLESYKNLKNLELKSLNDNYPEETKAIMKTSDGDIFNIIYRNKKWYYSNGVPLQKNQKLDIPQIYIFDWAAPFQKT